MEYSGYPVEVGTTTKRMKFQMCLNWVRQTANEWVESQWQEEKDYS